MTRAQVIALLEKNKQERGIEHWRRLTGGKAGKSFGLGLTQLRKIAKGIGRDHDLAQELWRSDVYDAKVIGLLIDDPKKMTRAQAEEQVAHLGFWMMAHVYCSCDAAAAKAPFAREMAVAWIESKDKTKRRCGYLLLAEMSKSKKDRELTDALYAKYIDRIAKTIKKEENLVRDAMNAFIFSVGQRNAVLHKKAVAAARAYWPIEVDYGDNSCQPVDVLKHLLGPHITKKVASA
jgi:3-methyladenine DNA glycosylase AlkD